MSSVKIIGVTPATSVGDLMSSLIASTGGILTSSVVKVSGVTRSTLLTDFVDAYIASVAEKSTSTPGRLASMPTPGRLASMPTPGRLASTPRYGTLGLLNGGRRRYTSKHKANRSKSRKH